MSLEANKEIVRNFFLRLGEGQMERALALVADDVQWWVQGSGTLDKATMRGIWTSVFGAAPGPNAMKVRGAVAEDDRVAAEIESDIKLPDGRAYRNTFHILFVMRGGQIAQAREYFDTAYAQTILGSVSH